MGVGGVGLRAGRCMAQERSGATTPSREHTDPAQATPVEAPAPRQEHLNQGVTGPFSRTSADKSRHQN